MDWLGAPAFVGHANSFQANQHHANTATAFNNIENHDLTASFTNGSFDEQGERFISNQIARANQGSTRANRQSTLKQFYAFLRATDRTTIWAPPTGSIKPLHTQRAEEEVLAKFALTRVIAGDAMNTLRAKISHVRMAYIERHFIAFGKGGFGTNSYTSRFITSMRRFFKPKSRKQERQPLMGLHLKQVFDYCHWKGQLNQKAAVLTAFEGLFRVSELCTQQALFNQKRHLCEDDIVFFPNFKNATHVSLFMGPSKTDQDATKAKMIPRTLRVHASSTMSAGQCIKEMLIHRHHLVGDEEIFTPTKGAPLFQKENGKHLRARQIATVITAALQHGGIKNYKQFSPHSLRIGGTTMLCKLGCPIRLLKLLGGWSSNCVLIYMREDAKSAEKYTRKMTKTQSSKRKKSSKKGR